MGSDVRQQERSVDRAKEWRRPLAFWVGGGLLAETLSGLAILWLPFSIPNQVNVIVHTVVGWVILVPLVWYLVKHWKVYSSARFTHVKLTGYFSLVVAAVLAVTGVVLTLQALFGTRIGYGWDLTHVIATFAILGTIGFHVGALYVRNRGGVTELSALVRKAEKSFTFRTLSLSAAYALLVWGLAAMYQPVELDNTLPDDYSLIFGEDRPFAPSLARTTTNDKFDPISMAGSQSCGTSGCHEQIVDEWQVSVHRWSAKDPAFRAIQTAMGQQNGPESTRYCAGCHDPISLFAGTKNLFEDELTNQQGLDEGISCISCHSIQETDVQGNAKYVIEQPDRYMFELRSEEPAARLARDYLIRAYPETHIETFSKRLFKSPEFCAACHKQFIDEEINSVGWVQLQNQYDNWRKSRWNDEDEPENTIECRECHMPLVDSRDPASGDVQDFNRTATDGKHRSHRFLGANQVVPLWLELEGAEEHVKLTEAWMRGEIEIPEIADRWRTGPAVPLEILAPDTVRAGEEILIRARMTNNKPGHEFPTGPLDIIQAWIEITVTDQAGTIVFQSGQLDEGNFIEPGSFIFKAEAVDRYGNLVDRHNLWEMVGVRYRRAMFPGFSDNAEFRFLCPSTLFDPEAVDLTDGDTEVLVDAAGADVHKLNVTAKLLYRKFDQFLLDFLAGGPSELTAPVTVISEDEATIVVESH
jgi:Cytochrome c554 and c-prime